jgi:hypothetical protein
VQKEPKKPLPIRSRGGGYACSATAVTSAATAGIVATGAGIVTSMKAHDDRPAAVTSREDWKTIDNDFQNTQLRY